MADPAAGPQEQACDGPSGSTGSILTFSEDGSVCCDAAQLSDQVLARSNLLWSLRDTAGSATVPIAAAGFHAWSQYHDGKADISASELASILEVRHSVLSEFAIRWLAARRGDVDAFAPRPSLANLRVLAML